MLERECSKKISSNRGSVSSKSMSSCWMRGLSLAWFSWVVIVTVVKYSPEYTTADTIMHSIMSIQRLTFYYWGQNRLANVLSAIVSPISNPELNLLAVLFISSASIYYLIWLIAKTICRIHDRDDSSCAPLIFIVLSLMFIAVLRPFTVSEIALGHIEYSMSAALLVSAYYNYYTAKVSVFSYSCVAFMLAASLGLNPSNLLLGLHLSASIALYNRNISIKDAAIVSIVVMHFLIWHALSKSFGTTHYDYSIFNIRYINEGVGEAANNIISALDLPVLFLWGSIISLIFAILFSSLKKASIIGCSVLLYSAFCASVFIFLWMLLFSCSEWVRNSHYSWRYYTYVFFSVLFITGCFIFLLFNSFSIKLRLISAAVMLFPGVIYTNTNYIPVMKYNVFSLANSISSSDGGLYAGDYFLVWPSVYRDLINQRESYGLSFRAESNGDAVRDYYRKKLESDDFVEIKCLNDTFENCRNQINSILGVNYIAETIYVNRELNIIKVSDSAQTIKYAGEELSGLPSITGRQKGKLRVSDGKEGFILFGPFVPIRKGKYNLTVYGESQFKGSSYIDIASSRGGVVHEKIPIGRSSQGKLVDGKVFSINVNVKDLEVRVWVDSSAEVSVSGYALSRIQTNNHTETNQSIQ